MSQDGESAANAETTASVDRAATDLVRYALACHASGKSIKREGIREHVMSGINPRSMKQVMDRANSLLELHFGLTMAPLPLHEKTLLGGEAQHTDQPHSASSTRASNKWVLQSKLPDTSRQRLELEQSSDEAAILGFAAAVLSLIFVNNMSMSVDQLVLYVRKLGPPECVLLPNEARIGIAAYATDAQMESAALEAISYLAKRGYLDKVTSAASGAQAHGETQATQAASAGDSDAGVEYTWGPQAKVEFQPIDMARFIAATTGQECTAEFIKTVGRAYGRDIAGAASS
ncbi:hypothetical protein GQ54DRAFT_308137 [Martensiomyces pterosporus]|nr:hypothetical protein GQ54DRAFT_308137 [Martensiomyces pterosporus]